MPDEISALREELARYKRDLAFTRAQLTQAWLGRCEGEGGDVSEEEIDPMLVVAVDAEGSGYGTSGSAV